MIFQHEVTLRFASRAALGRRCLHETGVARPGAATTFQEVMT
jgi:hypothetical protein